MLDERGAAKVNIEGIEYTMHFTIPKLKKLEKLLNRPATNLFPEEPWLTDMLILIEVGIGRSLPEMDRLPKNFSEVMETAVECLRFCSNPSEEEEGKSKAKKKK